MTEKERAQKWAHLVVDTRSGVVSSKIGVFLSSKAGKDSLEAVSKIHSSGNSPTEEAEAPEPRHVAVR